VIDYRKPQFDKVLGEKVDVVFDLIGGDTQQRSFLVLKEGGHLVAATQPVPQEETAKHRVAASAITFLTATEYSNVLRSRKEDT
jgi:NADPH:quinone reductase-like Zn-dependent oxidoreductase